MVAYPFAKSSVAFATGVPSAVFSWVLRRSVPGARLGLVSGDVVVVVVVVSLADWLPFAHPLNPIAGVTSKAPAMIAGLTMGTRLTQKANDQTTARSAQFDDDLAFRCPVLQRGNRIGGPLEGIDDGFGCRHLAGRQQRFQLRPLLG